VGFVVGTRTIIKSLFREDNRWGNLVS